MGARAGQILWSSEAWRKGLSKDKAGLSAPFGSRPEMSTSTHQRPGSSTGAPCCTRQPQVGNCNPRKAKCPRAVTSSHGPTMLLDVPKHCSGNTKHLRNEWREGGGSPVSPGELLPGAVPHTCDEMGLLAEGTGLVHRPRVLLHGAQGLGGGCGDCANPLFPEEPSPLALLAATSG